MDRSARSPGYRPTHAAAGNGIDACLAPGCLLMPVHFYSPVPSIRHIEQAEHMG
jgi:hypothetical protein